MAMDNSSKKTKLAQVFRLEAPHPLQQSVKTRLSPSFVTDPTRGFNWVFLCVSAYKFRASYSNGKLMLPYEAFVQHPTQWGPDIN